MSDEYLGEFISILPLKSSDIKMSLEKSKAQLWSQVTLTAVIPQFPPQVTVQFVDSRYSTLLTLFNSSLISFS